MKTQLTYSQAVEGFLLDARAERLSPDTIRNYTLTLRRFGEWLAEHPERSAADPPLAAITADHVAQFMASLAAPREHPGVAPRPAAPLSKKTALNYHAALGALWTWAVHEQVVQSHVIHAVPRPRPEKRAISPLTEADCKLLLAACGRSRAYKRPGKRLCDNARPTADRDRAIVLLLLDTGMRAGELCGLKVRDVDTKNRRLIVLGKGAKERNLPFSAPVGKALWRYLQEERGEHTPRDPLFVTIEGAPLTPGALLQLINSLGERAAVADCHPHRFRHTFAINFLRNGGNAYELQALLGHTTLEMVKSYLVLAQTDVEAAHRRASPVENWRL
jgi:site-specific recombinase XerD